MAYRFRPRCFELADRGSLDRALSALRAHRAPALFDSAAGDPCRWSVLGFDPLPLELDDARGIDGARAALRALALDGGDDLPGFFHGGFLGAFAYDLGVAGERLRLPRFDNGLPLVLGGLYVDFLVRDEARGRSYLVLGESPGDGRAEVAARRAAVERELECEVECSRPRLVAPLTRRTSPEEHRERIQRCRAAIAAGDLYQANLAHRFLGRVAGDPIDLYRRLRERNPAPYMGFLAHEVQGRRIGALLSSSPELFFEFDGRRARSRPIKGTRARAADPAEDERSKRELLASAKDLAELTMIVDLERNDLGRCSVAGGVSVEGFPTLKSYARVHHLMADVVAQVRDDVDAFGLLEALFPSGSISGCPKLRALERIAEFEREGRGFFSGSMGAVDLLGRAAFNVLIRTLEWRADGEVSFHVGGGITWSSDAELEERETLDKAAALVAALEDA